MRVLLIVIALALLAFSAWWYSQGYSQEVSIALGYAPAVIRRGGEVESPGTMTWLPMALDIFNTAVGLLGLWLGFVGLRRR